MSKLKTSDVVNAIAQLGTQRIYNYPSGNTKFKIVEVTKPEGPISFLRWSSRESEEKGSIARVSTNQLATIASVFSNRPDYPIHLDRLFSAGGNTRSALEALLANTPNFFICYVQRTHAYTGNRTIQKHLVWHPDKTHPLGEISETSYEQEISEIELDVNFGDIRVTSAMLGGEFDSIEAKKTHTQMQVALVKIGNAFNFKTWIAKNDRSIPVGNTQLGKLDGVLQSLEEIPIFHRAEMRQMASLIDCIWFTPDFNFIPAVIEVEHSTGVTSGLTRMLKFRETMPSWKTRFTVVADTSLRNKVVSEANNPVFRELEAKFMPYATVRELYGLIQKYNLSGVIEQNFVEPFLESVVEK